MTKPITTPAAAPTQGMNVAAAARATVAKAPNNFIELSGADLQALLNFQKTLPSSKGRKLIKTDDEEFATGEGTVTDSPEWVMAQANTGVVEVLVESGAGGAAGGAGGAAGGAAGAAGAAAAPMVMSPLAFLPAALVLPNGSDVNNRPTLTRESGKLTLAVNAATNDITSNPQWQAADPDNNTVFYFFQLDKEAKVDSQQVFNLDDQRFILDGKILSAISADGRFKINPYTGEISYLDSDENEPVLLCPDELALNVVVTDTALVSLPVEVIINRVLPEFSNTPFDEENRNTRYSASSLENSSESYINEWNDDHTKRNIDIFEIDNTQKFKKLSIHKDGMDLHFDYTFGYEDESTSSSFVIADQFGVQTNENMTATALDGKVEYVKFVPWASFNGYVLNGDEEDSLLSESGVYNLITNSELIDDVNTINGTDCKDVLVSSCDTADSLNGGKGNDLLFSYGDDDTLNGGAGNDLIVIDEHSDDTVLVLDERDAPPADTDHFDTVVGFSCNSTIELGDFVISFDDDEQTQSIDKIDVNTLETHLADIEINSEVINPFYLITTDEETGDADIWHFTSGENGLVKDHLAHFVGFDFANYVVDVVTPVLLV